MYVGTYKRVSYRTSSYIAEVFEVRIGIAYFTAFLLTFYSFNRFIRL